MSAENVAEVQEEIAAPAKPICGVIMPISATANQTEAHWSDVQTLLHRAIRDAEFEPQNVWENTSADRVSERIIANIFDHPLVVADISDLNPNVMLELGLRLASKKPTIVVVNSGGTIPFDIRDFHAVMYPSDMNMLAMEEFFRKLGRNLKEKFASFQSDEYQPFLGKVVVDVISPNHREVSLDEAIVDRLDEMNKRMAALESRRVPIGRTTPRRSNEDDGSVTLSSGSDCYFRVKGNLSKTIEAFSRLSNVEDVKILGPDGMGHFISVKLRSSSDEDDLEQQRLDLRRAARSFDCLHGIPSNILMSNGW